MNVMALLEYLDDELSKGALVPLTGRRMVDAEKCLDIISELRVNLPDDVRDAEVIVREKERIIKEARAEGDEIVAEAEKRFEEMISDHNVTREAQTRSQQMLAEAKKEAREIRMGAMNYAQDVFGDVEKCLQENLAEVRANRKDLDAMR